MSLIPLALFAQGYGQRLDKIVRLMRSVREVEGVTDALPHEDQAALLIQSRSQRHRLQLLLRKQLMMDG